MSSVNTTNFSVDQTVHIFDKFYEYSADVPAAEYDIVLAFFRTVMRTQEAAENFTMSLFRVANDNNIPVMTILGELQGQSAINVNATIAYYLNSIRSPATLLGVLQPTIPNNYTARNVVS